VTGRALLIQGPLILYIPGLLPKPEPDVHRDQLLRCLLTGIRRLDPAVAEEIESQSAAFDVVSWSYDFYGVHRDIDIDRADIDALLEKPTASERDIAEATAWPRRFARAGYQIGDLMPFLIPRLANEKLELHLRDLRRYNRNVNDIAEATRRLLKVPIEAACAASRPVLLLAHSMGSVIAFDALWQMSRLEQRDASVDLWLTMGSPLGGNYIQKRLLGRGEQGDRKYPANIRRWFNVAAVGEMTALDRQLGNDFAEMMSYGLVEEIVDHEIFTYYRMAGSLNVHAEYGYLVHEVTAGQVADWWRASRPASRPASL